MEALQPRAQASAPSGEIRQLVREEMGERRDARGGRVGVQYHLDQPRERIVFDDDPGEVVRDGDPTRPYDVELDTDEELLEDARPPEPLPPGRDPARRPTSERRSPDDPESDEQRLSGLL